MCGIAGRYNFRTGAPVDRDIVAGMCDLLAHRGPDGSGVCVDGAVGLGHRRLAVIDLSDAARQPMHRGHLTISFNGEIYNFRELRSALESEGHRFVSRSDTEVVLAAWQQWGPQSLGRLHGMFAFAIWDRDARALFLARDRLGKKPLCYWPDRDGLAFASEVKAFMADPAFEARPNPEALYHYLSLQYVPTPLSAFDGVSRVPPGHYLTVSGGALSLQRYWQLRYEPKRQMPEREALEQLAAELRRAVSSRLVSDVPLGAFLSGGIDSGLVVAEMAASAGARLRTFSIAFEDEHYNEAPFARQVADRYGTEHHEFTIRPDAVALLPKLAWHYDEPFADSSAVPTFWLAELTRPFVTVALTGDGGDEGFAGYDRYRALRLASRLARLPRPIRRLGAALGSRFEWKATDRHLTRARRFARTLALDPARQYAAWMDHCDAPLKADLCTADFRAAVGDGDTASIVSGRFDRSQASDVVDVALDVDVGSYLPDDLLVKVDIATMAHGLEARSPLLDHALLEWAAVLPTDLKLHGSVQKYLLRRLAEERLPADLVRRPKRGFAVPIDAWLRDDISPFARDILLGRQARERGYFRMSAVEQLIAEHAGGRRLWHSQLWTLLMFEMWHQTFVDRRGRTPAG